MIRGFIRFLFTFLVKVRIEGEDNIPESGPLIVAANHFHFVDPLAVIYAMPWPLDFIGGFHMRFAPLIVRWLPRLWGLYRVRREGSSRDALRQAEEALLAGGILGIFPEGGSWATVLRPPRPGSAFLATRTQARILPVGLDGLPQIFPCLKRLKRATVTIRIGKPIGPFALSAKGRAGRVELDLIGEAILRAIAELIPLTVRGVYSNDPVLRRKAEEVAAYPWAGGAFIPNRTRALQSKNEEKGAT
ncbi:1-acyl-sn-glycerol-3-phosphate acyltransferase [Candidatus Bipolaricaulota bacterium]|nr:1-acyl-sn-glycerol-3-phosphate acyltransferase [Candidatus Bipolaricaulota bacterium]